MIERAYWLEPLQDLTPASKSDNGEQPSSTGSVRLSLHDLERTLELGRVEVSRLVWLTQCGKSGEGPLNEAPKRT